jgi:hypothetical protein
MHQGDLITKIFVYWSIVFLGQFFKTTYSVTQYFGLLISTVQVLYKFRQKVGWAIFWAIFSQTRLVTMTMM